MFGIHDPWVLAAVFIIGGVALLILAGIVVANWKRISATANFLFARPVYLLDLYLRGGHEWLSHRHSPQYILANKITEIEQWLKEQEPELVVA